MKVQVKWSIYESDEIRSAVTIPLPKSSSALGNVLLGWLPQKSLDEWDDRRAFAGICRVWTDLTDSQVAGSLGLEPNQITECRTVAGPPWILAHPAEPIEVRIDREIINPEYTVGSGWYCPNCHSPSRPQAEMGARGSWQITCPHCDETEYVPSPSGVINDTTNPE